MPVGTIRHHFWRHVFLLFLWYNPVHIWSLNFLRHKSLFRNGQRGEGVIRNKLEGFSCEPCHAGFYRLHDGGGFIDGAAESWKHHILGTIYCYSLSLIRVILSLKRSKYLSLLTIHQYQWWIDFKKPKQIESKNKRKNEKNATDKVQCI